MMGPVCTSITSVSRITDSDAQRDHSSCESLFLLMLPQKHEQQVARGQVRNHQETLRLIFTLEEIT